MDAPSAAPGGDAYSVIYAVVHAFGLDRFLPVLLALHLLASALDAALPQPAPGSHWIPLRKLLSFAALSVGNATNAYQPALVTWLQRIVVQLAASIPPPPTAASPPPTPPSSRVEPVFPPVAVHAVGDQAAQPPIPPPV